MVPPYTGGDHSFAGGAGSSDGAPRSADGDHRSPDGGDPLMKAVLVGDLARIKGILGDRPRGSLLVSQKDCCRMLYFAARCGHLEICKYLVQELGIDASATYNGMTPLMASARSNDVQTVKYFLETDGDLKKADNKGSTVLHHAACAGSCEVIEFLLSTRRIHIDVDLGHGTALLHAALRNQDKALKILLDNDADVNSDRHGFGGPLMGALISGSVKCFELLIEAGADVNGNSLIMPPLLVATEIGGCTDFIQLLLKAGADPNVPNLLGRLPIELAALRHCKEEVELLFPLTSPIPSVVDWSVDGILSHAKLENAKPDASDGRETTRTSSMDNVKKICKKLTDLVVSMIEKTACSARMADGSIRNFVVFSLNGNPFDVLKSYVNSILHYRLWNYLRGICIDISQVFGYKRELFTTSCDGSFHFLVEHEDDMIDFVFDGRASWFHAWLTKDGPCQFQTGRAKPFMNDKNLRIVDFTGNYEDVAPQNSAGQIKIGLPAMIESFIEIRNCKGRSTMKLPYFLGTWVICFGEAPKFHRVFLCCCRSIIDRSITNMDSFDKSLGLLVRKWGKLCEPVVQYLLDCLVNNQKVNLHRVLGAIIKQKVPRIETVKDVLENICIWTHGSPRGKHVKIEKRASPMDVRIEDSDPILTYWKHVYGSNEAGKRVRVEPVGAKGGYFGVSTGGKAHPSVAQFVERRRATIFGASTWGSHLPQLKRTGPFISKTAISSSKPLFTWASPLQHSGPLRSSFVNERSVCTAAMKLLKLAKR